jgi:hypothetical protein
MQITIEVPDTLPQSVINREIKALEEKLKKQVEDNIAGCFSQYAKKYIPTSLAINQAWEEAMNEKYNSNNLIT